jgi:hypothetical protein
LGRERSNRYGQRRPKRSPVSVGNAVLKKGLLVEFSAGIRQAPPAIVRCRRGLAAE